MRLTQKGSQQADWRGQLDHSPGLDVLSAPQCSELSRMCCTKMYTQGLPHTCTHPHMHTCTHSCGHTLLSGPRLEPPQCECWVQRTCTSRLRVFSASSLMFWRRRLIQSWTFCCWGSGNEQENNVWLERTQRWEIPAWKQTNVKSSLFTFNDKVTVRSWKHQSNDW